MGCVDIRDSVRCLRETGKQTRSKMQNAIEVSGVRFEQCDGWRRKREEDPDGEDGWLYTFDGGDFR